jgi:methyl-accepting chemotaxis protein
MAASYGTRVAMFKDTGIVIRLGLCFGLLLALLAVVALIGVTRLAEVNSKLESVISTRYPKTKIADEVALMAADNARIARNIILLTDEYSIANNKNLYEKNLAQIAEHFDRLEKTVKSERGTELLNTTRKARAAYDSYTHDVINLALARKREEATTMLYGGKYKTEYAYFEAIKDVAAHEDEDIRASAKQAAEAYGAARSQMFVAGGIAILLGAGIAFWVARTIVRPLKAAAAATKAMREKTEAFWCTQ